MVRIPLEDKTQVYGLIHDIHIDDDGLVRQLVTADGIDPSIIEDNRANRNMPLEMSVLKMRFLVAGGYYSKAADIAKTDQGEMDMRQGRYWDSFLILIYRKMYVLQKI